MGALIRYATRSDLRKRKGWLQRMSDCCVESKRVCLVKACYKQVARAV